MREQGSPEVGMREQGSTEVGMREQGSTEVGMREQGSPEVGMGKQGSTEVGMREQGSTEVGMREQGSTEVGMREQGSTELGMREQGSTEVGMREQESTEVGKMYWGSNKTTFRKGSLKVLFGKRLAITCKWVFLHTCTLLGEASELIGSIFGNSDYKQAEGQSEWTLNLLSKSLDSVTLLIQSCTRLERMHVYVLRVTLVTLI